MTIDFSKFFVPDQTPNLAPAPGTQQNQAPQSEIQQSFVPDRTLIESGTRDVLRTGKAAGSVQLGAAGDIQDLLMSLTSKIYGVDPEKVKQKLASLSEEDSEIPSLFPTSGKIKEAIEAAAPSLKPETEGERKYEEAVELGSTLLGPGGKRSLLGKLTRAGLGTAAGMFAKDFAEEEGYSPTTQEWSKSIASIIPMIAGGKIQLTSPESKYLYESAKKAGLSEKQLTPLLQSEKKVSSLSKHLTETQEKRAFIESISEKIGNYYEKTKKAGRDVAISGNQLSELKSKTKDFLTDLEQTIEPSAQKKAAIEYVSNSLNNLDKDTTAEKLINWWQDINATVGEVKGGKKAINGLKPAIATAFHKANPELAKDFMQANALWEKRSKFLGSLGWENLESASKGSTPLKLLSNLAIGHYVGPKTMMASMIGPTVFKKISEKLLFDPNWQNINRTMAQSIAKESPKMAIATFRQLKKKLDKEMPEESNEVDWGKVFKED
jgi:hypothetical protein